MNRTTLLLACALAASAGTAFAEITLPDAPAPKPNVPATPATPPALVRVPFSDRIMLGNKDAFHGNFLAFSKEGGIEWQHPDCAAPFQFKTGSLDRIDLNQTVPQKSDADILILFNNGDTLAGKLVEYTPAQTVVETWFGGRLTFKSDSMRSLSPTQVAAADFLVKGFGKKSDWKIFNGSDTDITVSDDKLATNNGTGAARELPFPPKFKLDIEFSRQAQSNLYISLLGDQPDRGGNSYGIQLANNYVQVMRQTKNGGGRGLNNFQYMTSKKTLKLTICGDAETKTLVFFLNDKQLGIVNDPADFPKGKYLSLTGWNGEQKFTGLTLSAWNGSVASASGKAQVPEQDTVNLANKDQVSGQLLAIRGGNASLKTEFATMEIPLARIKRLDLSKASNRSPKPAKGDIQFCFDATEHLTLQLNAIKGGLASATSETFGECTLNLNAAKKLVFNLDAPFRKEKDEAEDEGNEDGDDNPRVLRNRVRFN